MQTYECGMHLCMYVCMYVVCMHVCFYLFMQCSAYICVCIYDSYKTSKCTYVCVGIYVFVYV